VKREIGSPFPQAACSCGVERDLGGLTVSVGSKNPVKANFSDANFPSAEIEISMHDVASGVPDQPWGDQETRQGALNRALACHAAHTAASGGAPPDFSVAAPIISSSCP